ncbi:MAG: hypothetical protein WDA22_17455 [Bacteroidota bacterium]
MRNKTLVMFFSFICFCSFAVAQNYTVNSSYQLGKYGEYYGIAGSHWIKTWNNEKVILRGTVGLFAGYHWGERATMRDFKRIELSIESRNTMVTGKDYFNIIGGGYSFASYNQSTSNGLKPSDNNGLLFSFGFGTKISSPAVVMARYIWGLERGIRLGMEFDF